MTTNFFSPLSFIAVFGSGIRDPGSGIRDPGSGIRDPGWVKIRIRDKIPDPQHCQPAILLILLSAVLISTVCLRNCVGHVKR
jgi:hypothetical protein